jgi:hypothetical protein
MPVSADNIEEISMQSNMVDGMITFHGHLACDNDGNIRLKLYCPYRTIPNTTFNGYSTPNLSTKSVRPTITSDSGGSNHVRSRGW